MQDLCGLRGFFFCLTVKRPEIASGLAKKVGQPPAKTPASVPRRPLGRKILREAGNAAVHGHFAALRGHFRGRRIESP